MGLDMFLYEMVYVGGNTGGDVKLEVMKDGKELPIDVTRVTSIRLEMGRWYKANAIHQWFVENVQNDNDDCGTYDVDEYRLHELLDLVAQVLEDHSKAPDLLPTQEGFFFGSTEYDEYYFKDLEDTKQIIIGALKEIDKFKRFPTVSVWFQYTSSW